MNGLVGSLPRGALVGLTTEKCVAWECASTVQMFGESLLGKDIDVVFPSLGSQLNAEAEVDVAHPNHPSEFLQALPSRTSGATFEWIVRFGHSRSQAADAILTAVTIERASLAETVHKGPHQVLTALLLQLGQLDKSANNDQLEEIRTLVNRIARELQTATSELSPPRSSGGLALRISTLTTLVQRHLGMRVGTPPPHDELYSQAMEDTAVRALRTLLLQAWQLGCPNVAVSLHKERGALRVVVELEEFVGSLEHVMDSVRSENFQEANGGISIEMEASTATVVLRFPFVGESGPVSS